MKRGYTEVAGEEKQTTILHQILPSIATTTVKSVHQGSNYTATGHVVCYNMRAL